jgi:ribosomal protein S12 methylthiotransferase accessory factor
MGITRVGNITGLDNIGIPVASAIRPNSRSVSVSLGKGLTLDQAMASAQMEAAENFHGEDIADRFRLASRRALSADAATADPARLSRTGRPYDDGVIIPWIEGYDRLRREPCFVPADLVHTDTTAEPGPPFFTVSSNGLASGNDPDEAAVAAICEVIERDAVARWKRLGLRARAQHVLDAATVRDPDCLALLDLYTRAGLTVRLFDVTTEIGVPTYVCEIRPQADNDAPLRRRFLGAACHPRRTIALLGALTEAAQTRLTYIAGARDDLPPKDYEDPATAEVTDALLSAFASQVMPRDFAAAPDDGPDDLPATIDWLLARLERAGCERVVVVDLTREDLGIPVVRAVIPGLEFPANPFATA